MDSISQEIVCQAHARTGILGNPSDQFEGKSISLSISNFYAEVKLATSEDLVFVPHPVHDPLTFKSLASLNAQTANDGFYGGLRLLKAICAEFYRYCVSHDVRLEKKNFTMSYDTNIPRHLGLAGSSAISTAGLSCLLRFYGVKAAIPVSQRPGIILKAETTLGIAAGLQNSVIQVHGGLLFMDFNPECFAAHGRGSYTSLPLELLPSFILLTSNEPHDSSAISAEMNQRWMAGDANIKEAVHQIAEIAEKGREALLDKDYVALGKLMDENFKLWRKMYGDSAVGPKTIRMVELAKSIGAYASSSGDGGAVLVLCPKGDMQVYSLEDICKKEGIGLEKVDPAPKLFDPAN